MVWMAKKLFIFTITNFNGKLNTCQLVHDSCKTLAQMYRLHANYAFVYILFAIY